MSARAFERFPRSNCSPKNFKRLSSAGFRFQCVDIIPLRRSKSKDKCRFSTRPSSPLALSMWLQDHIGVDLHRSHGEQLNRRDFPYQLGQLIFVRQRALPKPSFVRSPFLCPSLWPFGSLSLVLWRTRWRNEPPGEVLVKKQKSRSI